MGRRENRLWLKLIAPSFLKHLHPKITKSTTFQRALESTWLRRYVVCILSPHKVVQYYFETKPGWQCRCMGTVDFYTRFSTP